ncbi:uncharacterized protein LOC127556671 isoform X1 [Antechinus flavipes]|uniref:uncharacterized protein LOC127556671 isoform X1 n=1 Tax=Antechinus flavipes TaxID=38775 RepID=UPI0022356D24|nr:uncharacterized protein LOC127556671 isoform X1 [Antechinus flavipes]
MKARPPPVLLSGSHSSPSPSVPFFWSRRGRRQEATWASLTARDISTGPRPPGASEGTWSSWWRKQSESVRHRPECLRFLGSNYYVSFFFLSFCIFAVMKGPPERRFIVPMFSRPQRRKLFQSRAANGSELPIVEGSPLCAAAGGPGDSSLATSAPNRGHPGSLPPAPNGEQGNRKVVKEKGKGDQGKAESSPWLNARHVSLEGEGPQLLALENPASKAVQGCLVPLWPEALPGSTPGPREGHLAKDGPGLGGQEVGENGRRPTASLTEDKQLGEGLHLGLPPSPSREVGQQKGSRTPNTRFSDMDKGVRTRPKLSGGKKLPATTGRKAALPRGKRPETHPEAGQEAWIKDLDSLRRRMLQEIPELQALGKQEDVAAAVPTRQGIAMIQERLAAPAGASTIAPVALRLPPLLCLSWKVKNPKA